MSRHSYVHPTLRGLVNLLAPTPTDDPLAVSASASPGASDTPAIVSTPPGADRAESRAVEGSSVDVEPHSSPIGIYPEWRRAELALKYASPDEWDVECDGDGLIDDVELEESSEEWL
jgi:hypothetical protein